MPRTLGGKLMHQHPTMRRWQSSGPCLWPWRGPVTEHESTAGRKQFQNLADSLSITARGSCKDSLHRHFSEDHQAGCMETIKPGVTILLKPGVEPDHAGRTLCKASANMRGVQCLSITLSSGWLVRQSQLCSNPGAAGQTHGSAVHIISTNKDARCPLRMRPWPGNCVRRARSSTLASPPRADSLGWIRLKSRGCSARTAEGRTPHEGGARAGESRWPPPVRVQICISQQQL